MTEADIALAGGDRDIARWFNVDAFERAPADQLVSNVRTTPLRLAEVRGPGYVVLDLGIMKNIELGSRARLQLRLESYNTLNTTNLNNPDTTPTSTGFGTITSQNPFPRQFQLAARSCSRSSRRWITARRSLPSVRRGFDVVSPLSRGSPMRAATKKKPDAS